MEVDVLVREVREQVFIIRGWDEFEDVDSRIFDPDNCFSAVDGEVR